MSGLTTDSLNLEWCLSGDGVSSIDEDKTGRRPNSNNIDKLGTISIDHLVHLSVLSGDDLH